MPAAVESGIERWVRDGVIAWDDVYSPWDRQRAFHESPAKYRLFGGAAGPGKSFALLMEGVFQAHDVPRSNGLLLRRTFPELEESLMLYFRRYVPRELYRDFNDSKHVVTWWNDSTTRFGYCQSEKDVYQYQGAEFLFIGIDELTMFTLRMWQFLTSRNRCPVPESFPCMAGATNPGNIGHDWVKSLWIDRKAPKLMENPQAYDPAEYEFIPAKLDDNPIYANDANYRKALEALPTDLRRAFLGGDWNVVAGAYFDNFTEAKMVVRPETVKRKAWWPRWLSIDWGFEHPAAIYWHTAQPAIDEPEMQQPTRCVTYRELVTRKYTDEAIDKVAPRELAREIIRRSDEFERRDGRDGGDGHPDAIYLSPDAFAKRTDEASIAEQMGDVFRAAGWPFPEAADNDRIGGWMLMYQMLDAGQWVLTENCGELIRTLPTLTRDARHIEDIEKRDGDDAADAARYGIKSRYRGSVNLAPFDERVKERVKQYAEKQGATPQELTPQQVAMMSRHAQSIERKRGFHRKPKFRPGRVN